MQFPRKKLLIAAAVGGVGLLTAGAVMASGRGGPGHHGGPGGMVLMDNFDTNGDGKLTQAEIDAARKDRLTKFDADGNGELSLQEYEALWADAMRRAMVRQFQFNDADGNGSITVEEFTVRYDDVVRDLDRNGDGELTRDELRRPDRGPRHGRGPGPGPDDED